MCEEEQVTLIQHGDELDVEWKIEFASLSETYLFSPEFTYEGKYWQLEMQPNGCKYSDTAGFIRVHLIRLSYNASNEVDFTFSLKSVNGQKVLERRESANFQGRTRGSFEKFMSKSDLIKRQSEFLVSGYFTLVCTLKKFLGSENCSYCQKAFADVDISSHEKKCRVKCPECSDIILLENWNEHECLTIRTEAATNTTGSFVICQQSQILHDLKQIFQNKEICDVVLRVKGQEFEAHKVILAARSSVFASTFRNDMKEKETGIVDIEDCDPSVFKDFLYFLYSGDLDILSEDNVFGLFTAADKYNIQDLRKMCLEFMELNIYVDTFCETLALALLHSEAELVQSATDFFIKNAGKILVTVRWQKFATENPIQSNELFIKYVQSVGGSNT